MNLLIAERMQSVTPFYVMELLQRAQELQRQGRDIIHMEIGEPDFPTPEPILRAGERCLRERDIKYTPAAGLPELRQAIAEDYRRRHGVSVDWRRVFVTPGASGALLLAFACSVNPGETVMMADPGYPCNANFLRLLGAEARWVPVGAATAYQLNAALAGEYWLPRVRGVLTASPSNPAGSVLHEPELAALIAETERRGGVYYSDEIYQGLEYGPPLPTALSFSEQAFVINSFSKFYGMTGWRAGWLVAPEACAESVERLAQNLFLSTSTVAQYAALAAFAPETAPVLEARREEFRARRDFLYAGLLRLGFSVPLPPEGAFYVYADCRAFTEDSLVFARDLLERTGVAVTPGLDFDRHAGKYHLRFAYTASMDKMADGLTRLEKFLCR